MPREKRYASAAARQQAYRDRKRAELEQEGLPARSLDEEPESPPVAEAADLLDEASEQLGISLEDYVAATVKEAAAYADSVAETDAPYTVMEGVVITNRRSDRIARAEAYARWRYQGVLAGEVARL